MSGAEFSLPQKPISIAQQLKAISPPVKGHHLQLSDLPVLRRGRYLFTLEEWVHKVVPRRSWVLEYGFALVLTAPYHHHRVGTAFWLCKICDTKGDFTDGLYNFSQASSSCNKHLRLAHRIIRPTAGSEEPISPSPQPLSQLSVIQAFQNTPPCAYSRHFG